MTPQIKALFAKHSRLAESVGGLKTQQGFLRKEQAMLRDDCAALMAVVIDIVRYVQFHAQLIAVFTVIFTATFIIGQILE
jgi:hypothetical protein